MKGFTKHVNSENVYENDTNSLDNEKTSETRLDLNTLLNRMKKQQAIDKKNNIYIFIGVGTVCLALGIAVLIY